MKKRIVISALIIAAGLSLSACRVTRTAPAEADGGVEKADVQAAPAAANDNEEPRRQLRLMQFSLIFMNMRYVEPDRIDWRKMTVHGIDALQNMVPEVVARFDKRVDEGPTKLTLHVGDKSKAYDLGDVESLSRAYLISEDVYNFVYNHLIDPKDAAELEYAMINGMFSTLDPHTNLLPPYMFEDVMTGNGGFAGCGFVVGVRDDNLVVISPMEGTPAWRAGIKAGDVIIRIDDESTENMPLQDAVDRMRGDVGTKVTLYVKRRGWTEAQPIIITREVIQIKSVTSHAMPKDNIGYIKLKSFDQTTGSEVKSHLAKLHKAMPKMKGLIIDLRNNSGGLLTQSIDISEIFLKKGQTIVSVEGATPDLRDSTKALRDGTERDYPIVILTNGGSASASEIVSGALQYHDRAIIVGERSFGKGSVQVLKDNPDGSAVKVTSAQYLTPGDISIQGVGIVPDIQLIPAYVDEKGISLIQSHNARRESSLEQSLHSNKTTQRESLQTLRYIYASAEEDAARAKELGLTTYDLRSTEDYTPDSEIDFSVALLKQSKSSSRSEILQQSGQFFAQYMADYRSQLTRAMKSHQVDWTDGKTEPCKQFEWGLKFGEQTSQDGGRLEFAADGEEKQLTMWVKNTCETEELAQLSSSLTSNNGAFDEREFAFGKIAPGQTREWPIKIKIPRSMAARDDEVKIQFYQGADAHILNQAMDTAGSFTAAITRLSKPRFVYQYWIDDIARGNADGRLSRGESVDMYIRVKNTGNAKSDKVNIHIANESGSGVMLVQGKASIDNLEPGKEGLVKLKFDVSKDRPQKPPSKRIKRDKPFNPDEASFRLTIADDKYDESIEQDVSYPVSTDKASVEQPNMQPMQLAANTAILTEPKGLRAIGATTGIMAVESRDIDEETSAVCWKEGEERPCGFASKSSVQPLAGKQESLALTPVFSYEAPQIAFEQSSHTIDAPNAKISFILSDNEDLRDYEAYVWTQDGIKIKVEKIDFALVDGKEKRVSIDMPLKLGDNSLVIVARDKLHTENVGIFHINRNK